MSKQSKTYQKVQVRDGKTYYSTTLSELGRIEKEVDIDIKTISSDAYRRNYDPIKVDEFKKQNKIGPYREWVFNHKRIEEIQQQVIAGEAHMHPDFLERYEKKGGNRGRAVGSTGKKNITKQQLKREQEQLINEIENG